MLSLIHVLNGAVGRLLRVALGVALIGYGLVVLGGTAGVMLAAVGLVPIGLGVWGRCLLEVVARNTPRTA